MDFKHEMYLEEGERIYIGKVDSLEIHPGENRASLKFWIKDPRAQSVVFSWVPYNDSITLDLERTSSLDSFEVQIGDIAEGRYTLRAISYDREGDSSLPLEKSFRIYGDNYQSSLVDRIITSISFDDNNNSLDLNFSEIIYEGNIGIEIFHTNLNGEEKDSILYNQEITYPLTFPNIDVTKGVSYRSIYLPDTLSVDTFYTDVKRIEISQKVNVVLNKPVLVSGTYNTKYVGENAVDGIVSNNSRWLSENTDGEHWIEIDLEQEYKINSFKTLMGVSGNFSNAVPEFIFQAEIDGEWVNIVEVTGNVDPEYEAFFPEVTTSKVRYFVPDYPDNLVRLYEIYVYTTVVY
jgi:hypothetical protein